MKKILITVNLIILVIVIFQTNKKDDLKSNDGCPAVAPYIDNAKPITGVQCANIICHNAGTCEKELLTAMIQ